MSRVLELAQRYWETRLADQPSYATLIGNHEYDAEIEDLSDEARNAFTSRLRGLLAEVEATPADENPVTRALLAAVIRADLVEEETEVLVWPVDPNIGIHSKTLRFAAQTRALEPGHGEALTERYAQIPRMLDQALGRHRRQVKRGLTPAAASVQRAIDQIEAYLASELAEDAFVNLSLPEGWDRAETWRSRMEEMVRGRLRPAYARYRDDLMTEILPAARPDAQAGLRHLPEGEDIYSRLVERFVTVPYDPTEIHRIGHTHATETLRSEYAFTGAEAFGISDHTELFDRLRTDPALRYGSAEEMLEHGRQTVARAWAAIDGWLGARPDGPCEVHPVPASLAKDMPPAYYMQPAPDGSRPGIYFLNTHQPDTRDRFMAEATTFHEAIPGHHFDRALASALDGLPAFRRFLFQTVHAEGWGLYSERLADEMGLYSGPVDRLGMLTADSWRAARLVVDTGLHHHGWTRDQAVRFMVDWTPINRPTIEQEVDRYIGWPGQALSYKMGQVEITRLRALAEARLGRRFDIVSFHDAVLTSGSLTIPVLEDLVTTWIDSVV